MTGKNPSTLSLIDSHCHLDDAAFDHDRQRLQQQAASAGITHQILPAITARKWPSLHQVTTEHPGTFAAYGLHPMFMDQHEPDAIEHLSRWLRQHPETVAVGECGLDFSQSNAEPGAQLQLFADQLELARELSLPVIIHARGAVEAVIDLIRSIGHHHGVVHSFNGSEVQAARLIDLGFRLGFGGAMTFTRAKKLRRLVTQLPLDALLLETDAPWQSDAVHAGKRNEPAWLKNVFDEVCSLRPESADVIAHATCDNAKKLFRLDR